MLIKQVVFAYWDEHGKRTEKKKSPPTLCCGTFVDTRRKSNTSELSLHPILTSNRRSEENHARLYGWKLIS